jgi:hypothetical protein
MQCGMCGSEIKAGFETCPACGATRLSGNKVRIGLIINASLILLMTLVIGGLIAGAMSSMTVFLIALALPAYFYYKAFTFDTSQGK